MNPKIKSVNKKCKCRYRKQKMNEYPIKYQTENTNKEAHRKFQTEDNQHIVTLQFNNRKVVLFTYSFLRTLRMAN